MQCSDQDCRCRCLCLNVRRTDFHRNVIWMQQIIYYSITIEIIIMIKYNEITIKLVIYYRKIAISKLNLYRHSTTLEHLKSFTSLLSM